MTMISTTSTPPKTLTIPKGFNLLPKGGHGRNVIRQFRDIFLPVSQSRMIAIARIFVGKPAVIQQKHVDTERPGLVKKAVQLVFIKVELRCFPVIQ